jgi:hypothetical protein
MELPDECVALFVCYLNVEETNFITTDKQILQRLNLIRIGEIVTREWESQPKIVFTEWPMYMRLTRWPFTTLRLSFENKIEHEGWLSSGILRKIKKLKVEHTRFWLVWVECAPTLQDLELLEFENCEYNPTSEGLAVLRSFMHLKKLRSLSFFSMDLGLARHVVANMLKFREFFPELREMKLDTMPWEFRSSILTLQEKREFLLDII